MGIRERRRKQLLYNVKETRGYWKLKNEALNRHLIDLLMKKLRTSCYTIRIIKTNMSASALNIICHTFLHSAMSYGIILWGNSSHSSTIFSMQKWELELWKDVGTEFYVETHLGN
jgi:hypothetical protein